MLRASENTPSGIYLGISRKNSRKKTKFIWGFSKNFAKKIWGVLSLLQQTPLVSQQSETRGGLLQGIPLMLPQIPEDADLAPVGSPKDHG